MWLSQVWATEGYTVNEMSSVFRYLIATAKRARSNFSGEEGSNATGDELAVAHDTDIRESNLRNNVFLFQGLQYR